MLQNSAGMARYLYPHTPEGAGGRCGPQPGWRDEAQGLTEARGLQAQLCVKSVLTPASGNGKAGGARRPGPVLAGNTSSPFIPLLSKPLRVTWDRNHPVHQTWRPQPRPATCPGHTASQGHSPVSQGSPPTSRLQGSPLLSLSGVCTGCSGDQGLPVPARTRRGAAPWPRGQTLFSGKQACGTTAWVLLALALWHQVGLVGGGVGQGVSLQKPL